MIRIHPFAEGMITNGNAEVVKSATNGNTIVESSADEMTMEVDPSPSSSSDLGTSVGAAVFIT